MTLARHNPAEVIYAWLLQKQLGSNPEAVSDEWPVYVNFLPDGPNDATNVIAVSDTTPRLDGNILKTGEVVEHPGIQIRVRGYGPLLAYQKIAAIDNRMQMSKRQEVILQDGDGAYVVYTIASMTKESGPLPLGKDSMDRQTFTLNFTITVSST